jgi:hypothetical protein
VPPATHGDFQILRAGKSDGLDDILLIGNLHDHPWVAHRRQLIPNELAPNGAMSVLVQVSSMKTSRSASTRP